MPSEVPTKDKPSKDKNYLELHDPAVHESKRWTIDSAGNKENLIPPKGQRSTFRIDPPSNCNFNSTLSMNQKKIINFLFFKKSTQQISRFPTEIKTSEPRARVQDRVWRVLGH
jgi:hypothetical protein